MSTYPRIVFYGTPAFAVASLRSLAEEGMNVAGVVTAPDKPVGRGLKLAGSPVSDYALGKNLCLLKPVSLKDPSFLEELRALKPDIQVVVAFRMMPKAVWSLPSLGTFNLHASLLPQYRGAAPINWAVINGETETGITTFLLEDTIDTGKILFTERTAIGAEETAGEVHDRLMALGGALVVKTVHAIVCGEIEALPQTGFIREGMVLKPAPKFSKEDARINWSRNYQDVFNRIRGMSPNPGAFTDFPLTGGRMISLKILRAVTVPAPGTLAGSGFQTDKKSFLRIPATDGFLSLRLVQPAGGRVMEIGEFLNGFGRQIS
jgi:methionyl-tRNA formyltransferase